MPISANAIKFATPPSDHKKAGLIENIMAIETATSLSLQTVTSLIYQ